MVDLARPLFGAALDFLYPPTCALCDVRLHPYEQIVCDPCRAGLLQEDTWRCPRCGATGRGSGPSRGEACPKCPPPGARYEGILAVTTYNESVARIVHSFKYHRRIEAGRLMGDLMVARLAEPLLALEGRVGCVVPVPLHWTRRIGRGFNQSRDLGAQLSRALGLPLEAGLMRRNRRTRQQAMLRPEERARNVEGAFEVAARWRGKLPGVLLIDDVVTTGHTIRECARVLREAGAPQVWGACFARS